jgi:hypothetical protein
METTMNDLIDDQELQRLLDGTLPAEQRALLLQYAEDHPANWRRISLAFVEEQVLREQLLQLAAGEALPADARLPVDADAAPRSSAHASARSSAWARGLAQAAAVCLLLGAAVWLGRISVDRAENRADGQASSGGPPVANSPQVSGSPAAALVNSSPDDPRQAGDYTIILTPDLVSSRGDGRMANSIWSDDPDAMEQMFTPLFDQQSRGIFRDHGYTVNEEPVIFVVQGRQGEQYVLPRRNVSLVAHRP